MEAELERLSKSNDEEKLKNEELRTKLNASALALQQEKQLVRNDFFSIRFKKKGKNFFSLETRF
jgi:hypothetical protein